MPGENLKRRTRFYIRQGGKCHYCNGMMALYGDDRLPNHCTIDHLVPRKRGGADALYNMVAACRKCNTVKGLMTVQEFLRYPHLAKEVARAVGTTASIRGKMPTTEVNEIISRLLGSATDAPHNESKSEVCLRDQSQSLE